MGPHSASAGSASASSDSAQRPATTAELLARVPPNPTRQELHKYPNVYFYRGMLRTSEGNLQQLHGWRGNYRELEVCHAYIQWFFPNYFPSAFNSGSYALHPEEAEIFRADRDIAERFLRSYEIFLDFLGLQLFNHETGAVGRAPGGEERLYAALVMHPHNRLRMRRLLASLAVVGFRHYMAPLVHHLEWEITGKNEAVSLDPWVTVPEAGRPADARLVLHSLRNNPRCLATWLLYVDGDESHFQQNTRAVPADMQRSVLFSTAATK